MRLMSNFGYKDSKGKIVQVPVRYGDMSRQVAMQLTKNSENILQSAPFIACYIKGLDFARDRLQDPTFVSKVNIRERAYDENGQEYLNVQGANYTVERLMPTPFNLQFTADIWTTNTDQKLQLLEQMLVLFNPSMEIQTNNNFIDWTSLSLVELTGMTFSSRQVPQGIEQDIDIATLNFQSPIWLTTPAKVKKLGIITNIITSMFADDAGTIEGGAYPNSEDIDYFSGRVSISISHKTIGNAGVLILNNTAKLLNEGEGVDLTDPNNVDVKLGPDVNWLSILDLYPGKFKAGLSTIRLTKPDGNEIVGNITLDPQDDSLMRISFDDQDTLPRNTDIVDLDNLYTSGTVDAIVDPTSFNPRPYLPNGALDWPATNYRLLILEDINTNIGATSPDWSRDKRNISYVPATYDVDGNIINPEIPGDPYDGADAWENKDGSQFTAKANDIVQWDGVKWNVILESETNTGPTYITNTRTGVQYVWDGSAWMKSFEGVYTAGQWRLVL